MADVHINGFAQDSNLSRVVKPLTYMPTVLSFEWVNIQTQYHHKRGSSEVFCFLLCHWRISLRKKKSVRRMKFLYWLFVWSKRYEQIEYFPSLISISDWSRRTKIIEGHLSKNNLTNNKYYIELFTFYLFSVSALRLQMYMTHIHRNGVFDFNLNLERKN